MCFPSISLKPKTQTMRLVLVPSVFPLSLSLLVLTSSCIQLVTSANILFYFGNTGYSHMSSIWSLVELISTNGHNVTVVAGMQPKVNNGSRVNVIFVEEVFEVLKAKFEQDADLIQDRLDGRQFELMDQATAVSLETCKIILHSPSTHDLFYNSQFDLVVIDNSFNECGMLLSAYQYKAPFVFWQSFPIIHNMYEDFGLPLETNIIPDMQYANELDFPGRFLSTLRVFKWIYNRRRNHFDTEKIVKDALGLDHTISTAETFKKTSLVLSNLHYTTDYARSLPPLFVPVSGMQITDKRKPIPKDMLEFIEKPGSDGIVYVSFGTLVQFSKCKPELRNKFMYAMGNQTRLRFLWKWEGKNIPKNAPSNIYFSKWFPQQDILAHRNIKGYIAHGGINGLHEAIYFGVPMIIFPIMGDQDFNAKSLNGKGIAIKLEITSFTQTQLEKAIQQIVNNQTLRQSVAETSNIFKDRPMKPVDTALWWLEYVLRHPKKSYLISPGVNQSFVERWLLDVAALVFLVTTLLILSALYLAYKLVRLVVSSHGVNVAVSVVPLVPQPHQNGKAKLH